MGPMIRGTGITKEMLADSIVALEKQLKWKEDLKHSILSKASAEASLIELDLQGLRLEIDARKKALEEANNLLFDPSRLRQ